MFCAHQKAAPVIRAPQVAQSAAKAHRAHRTRGVNVRAAYAASSVGPNPGSASASGCGSAKYSAFSGGPAAASSVGPNLRAV